MAERRPRRAVIGESLRTTAAEQANGFGGRGEERAGLEQLHAAEPQRIEPCRGGAHPGVRPLGEHNATLGAPRPLVQRVPKPHLLNFRLSACSTAG